MSEPSSPSAAARCPDNHDVLPGLDHAQDGLLRIEAARDRAMDHLAEHGEGVPHHQAIPPPAFGLRSDSRSAVGTNGSERQRVVRNASSVWVRSVTD